MSSIVLRIRPKPIQYISSNNHILKLSTLRLTPKTLQSIPSSRLSHRSPSTNTPTPPPKSTPHKSTSHHNTTPIPNFNLFLLLREAKASTRYTVYFGLGLMATVESTFWFNVIKAKFFPSADGDAKEKGEEFLERLSGAVEGYRKRYLGNYQRYYGGYVWGVGER